MIRSKANGVFMRFARTNRCRLDQILDRYARSEVPQPSASIPLVLRNSLNNLNTVTLTCQTKRELAAWKSAWRRFDSAPGHVLRWTSPEYDWVRQSQPRLDTV